MLKKFSNWTGLRRWDAFESDFFYEQNVKSSIYMAVIIIVLELWVMFLVGQRASAAGKTIDLAWALKNLDDYLILLGTGIVVLVHGILHVKGVVRSKIVGNMIIIASVIICLRFGVLIGVHDYSKGNQVLAFVTMVVFICLFVLPPWFGFVSISGTFLIFYFLCDQASPASYGFQVNLFTAWLTMYLVSYAVYRTAFAEANKERSLRQKNEELEDVIRYDGLTRLYSVRQFSIMSTELLSSTEPGELTMIYTNIENFRPFNEALGHTRGDDVLCEYALKLRDVFPGAPIGRLEADHFAVLVKTDPKGYDEPLEELANFLHGQSKDIRLLLKVGAYVPMEQGEGVSLVIDKARTAARTINQKAELRVRYYDNELMEQVHSKQMVIGHIDEAVEKGYIKVHYQPVMNCQTGEVYGFEALARWDDPERGLLSPGLFIPTLEECHMIDRVDKAVVEQVCIDLKSRIDRGLPTYPVSVNFSRVDFELYDVPSFAKEVCDRHGVPHHLVEIEITESALTTQQDKLHETLDRLEADGFSLWLDDFGSGYSSLNVLKDYRFSVMKIDMVFMRELEKKPEAKKIVQAMINLARGVGMIPLTEGVETAEQLEFLREAGCERVQGYHFSRPRPLDEIEGMLERNELHA